MTNTTPTSALSLNNVTPSTTTTITIAPPLPFNNDKLLAASSSSPVTPSSPLLTKERPSQPILSPFSPQSIASHVTTNHPLLHGESTSYTSSSSVDVQEGTEEETEEEVLDDGDDDDDNEHILSSHSRENISSSDDKRRKLLRQPFHHLERFYSRKSTTAIHHQQKKKRKNTFQERSPRNTAAAATMIPSPGWSSEQSLKHPLAHSSSPTPVVAMSTHPNLPSLTTANNPHSHYRRSLMIQIDNAPVGSVGSGETSIRIEDSPHLDTPNALSGMHIAPFDLSYNKKHNNIPSFVRSFFYFPIRQEGFQFFFAAIWMLTCVYWNSVVQILVQNEVIRKGLQNDSPLIDLGFSILPYITVPLLADYYLFAVIGFVIMKTIISRGVGGTLTIARRMLFCHGFIFVLRSVSISITMLPNPWSQCQAKEFSNPFSSAFMIILGFERTCSDCLFSGHSVAMALMGLSWFTYTDHRFVLIRLSIIPVVLGGLFVLIATHFHYTVDVFYGTTIATVVWISYHYLIRVWREWLEMRVYRNYLLLKYESESSSLNATKSKLSEALVNRARNKTTVSELVDEYMTDVGPMPTKANVTIYHGQNDDITLWIENDFTSMHTSSDSVSGTHEWLVEGRSDTQKKSVCHTILRNRYKKLEKEQLNAKLLTRRIVRTIKRATLIVVLKFLIWFESWKGYLEMDFASVTQEIEQKQEPKVQM